VKDKLDAILQLTQARYLESLVPPRDALLDRMEAFAAEENHPIADPEVAQLLRVLVALRQPRRILEVGTNIGYSVIVMGRECGEETVIETIELDRGIRARAQGFVHEAGLACRVVFHAGAALDVIPTLDGPFDFVFIDCVKSEYEQYLDGLLPRLSHGALVVCDNLLWKGKVAEGAHDTATDALRAFNQRITSDPRLLTTIVPVGDGTGISIVR
jgi:predicted O-methyltransferase YrrM